MPRVSISVVSLLLVLALVSCASPQTAPSGDQPATASAQQPSPRATEAMESVTSAPADSPTLGAPTPTATVSVTATEPAAIETTTAAEGPIVGAEPTASEQPASGSLIAYTHEGNIWLLNHATGETRRVTSNGTSDQPAWTADRRALLFVVRDDEDTEIYTMPVDGAPELLVDGPAPELFPAVAPDGAIYYVRHIVANELTQWQIVRHAAVGEGEVIYSLQSGLCAAGDLQVSDSRWMLALGCGRGTVVMVGELAGGEGLDLGQQLGAAGSCLYGGAWSRVAPDQLFVLQSNNCDPANASTITSVDMASGTPATEPTYRGRGIWSLDTSPDGRELVFAQSSPDGTAQGLWLVDVDGQSTPRQIVEAGTSPAWRP